MLLKCWILLSFFLFSADARKELPFADGKFVKNEVELQILDLLGPKTADDLIKPAKGKVCPF